MIKRLVSIFLVLILSVSALSMATYALDNNDNEKIYSEEFEILNALEIISETDSTRAVTRGKFLELVYRLYTKDNIDAIYENNDNSIPYVDVSKDFDYYAAVCFAYKHGLIGELPGRKLNPESNITIDAAADILSKLCGYPSENSILANKFKREIKTGVSQDGDLFLNMNEAAIILYNALTSEIVEPVVYSNNGVVYGTKENITLFYACRGIHFGKGELTETPYNSLFALDGNGRYVKIDGINFLTENADKYVEYIGYQMRYFYTEDKGGDKKLVYAMPLEEEMEFLSVDAEDIVGVKGNKFTYFDKNDKQKSITLEKGVRVMYNGELYNNTDSDIFKIKYGNVKLINNDQDGAYDVVLIFEYDNYTVHNVDKINKKIIEKYNGGRKIDYGIADESSFVRMRDIQGNLIEDVRIGEWNVITALISKDGGSVDIINSNSCVIGEVTRMNKTRGTVIISDEEYELWEGYERSGATPIVNGSVGTFYLDAFGKIAAFKAETRLNSYACMIDCINYKKAFKDTLIIKVLTTKNEIKKLELKKGCKIDGVKYEGGEIPDVLSEKPQVICYYTDKDGLVYSIKTAKSEENKNVIRQLGDEVTTVALIRGNSFQNYYEVKSSAIVFKCPWDGLAKIVDEDYEVIPTSRIKENSEYNVTGFTMGTDSMIPDIFLMKETSQSSGISTGGQKGVVQEVFVSLIDGCAEPVISVVSMWGNSSAYTFRDHEVFSTSNVQPGDIVSFAATDNGQITDMKVIFKAETQEITNSSYAGGIEWGDIVQREDGYIGITKEFSIEERPEYGFHDLDYFCIDPNLLIIVDTKALNGRGEIVRRGVHEEMYDYKHYGSECGRAVVITSNWWIGLCVVYI